MDFSHTGILKKNVALWLLLQPSGEKNRAARWLTRSLISLFLKLFL